jgi:glycosyltransferase involved in cell wall biosynthesis
MVTPGPKHTAQSESRPPALDGSSGPLVTVLVPVYNGAGHLRESLDSIVAIRYAPLEIIVLDDASTDETPAIVASYGDRVRSVRQPHNLGQFGNVNAGLALAGGEFVAVFHADDVYEPDIVAREVEFLQAHPEAGAVFCLDKFIDARGVEYGRLTLPPETQGVAVLDYTALLEVLLRRKNRILRAPGAMVRRSVYADVGGFDASYEIGADLEMWLRIARRYPLGLLHEHLFRYRHFHGNLSHHYRHLRTAPDVFFRIMDECLAGTGGTLVSRQAVAGFEAHRTEERLMNTVSHYIAGDLASARRTLAPLRTRTILGARTVQRSRLVMLLWLLRGLTRLPHVAAIGEAFRRRWYGSAPPVAPT